MADIFLSYRRDDSRADAGRLHDRLSQRFGHRQVFMDVDDVEPGVDFVELLQATLNRCGVVVAVIGNDWLGRNPAGGPNRLDRPDDFVHIEIRTALERGIPVLPVLVGGATMPAPDQVPPALAPLLKRQAIEVRHTRFDDDVEKLIDALAARVGGRGSLMNRRYALAASAAVLAGAAGYGAWRFVAGREPVRLRTEPAMLTVDAARAMVVQHGFYEARWNPGGNFGSDALEQRVIGEHVVVIDDMTGLMWQHSAPGSALVRPRLRATARRLNDSAWAGFSDWRIPTLEESMSLMRAGTTAGYHLAKPFDAGSAPFIWTADRSDPDSGWIVYYHDGIAAPEKDRFNAYLRAVRTHR